ncbi:MAG: ATP-binding protein [Pseudomonadales bacterium]|jgi:PAS domain S-box-containing protein|nr:ATP-binding protein [Pseudomonadales bacterium]
MRRSQRSSTAEETPPDRYAGRGAAIDLAVGRVRRRFALGFFAVVAIPAVLFPALLKISELPPPFRPYADISGYTALFVLLALPCMVWLLDHRLRRHLRRLANAARDRALRASDVAWVRVFALETVAVMTAYLCLGVVVVGLDVATGLEQGFHLPSIVLAALAVVILVVYMLIPLYLVTENLLGEELGPLLAEGIVTRAWVRVFLSGPGVVLVTLTSMLALARLLGLPMDPGLMLCAVTLTLYAICVSVIAQRGEERALQPLFRFSSGLTLAAAEREAVLEAVSLDEIGQLVRDVRSVAAGEQAALEQVRASEARFRQFAEAASDWFFEIDAELRFSWVSENLERIIGVPAESVVGLPAVGMSAVYRETDFDPHRDDLENHRPYRNYRFAFKDSSGRTRHLQVSGDPRFDEDGTFLGYRGAGTDITDLVETQSSLEARTAELSQAQKMEAVGQLTGGIAHDFNNLLTVVLGNLELARQADLASQDERDELVQAIEEANGAAQRGAELVRRLMAFSRKQTLQPERVYPARLLRSMEPLLRSALGENITTSFEQVDEAVSCFCDPGQLESALLNLAINARDAMPSGGVLRFRVDAERVDASDVLAPGDYVRIEVEDTGTGIDEAQQKLVFEPFFTTKGQGEGTGLGLSMVYGFTRQSGGNASLDSVVGEGTTIALLLPAQPPGEPGTDARAEARRQPVAGTGEHVLVVEDEDAVRMLVVKQLERLGFRCSAFGASRDALAWLERGERVDLLLTDIVLAEPTDGLELARRVRRLRPQLPVVYMTGYTQHFDELESARFVTKPFSVEDLAATVRQAIEAAPGGAVGGGAASPQR